MIPAIGSTFSRLDTGQIGATAGTGLSSTSGMSGASGVQGAGADFATVLSQVAGDAVSTVKGAEAVSIKGINGQASTQAVVDAVMAAERTLQTAVSLRDKAIGAYTELTRMQM